MHKPVREKEEMYLRDVGGYKLNDGTVDYCTTEVEVSRAIHALVYLLRPKNIIETGTFGGYTTYYMAKALEEIGNGGTIYSIDPTPQNHLFTGASCASHVKFINKLSSDALNDVPESDIDLILLDSDHAYPTVMFELEAFEPRLKEGGVILMHDAILHDGVGLAVQELYKNPRFEVVTLDTIRVVPFLSGLGITPGLVIARKIRSGYPELKVDANEPHIHDTIAENRYSILRRFNYENSKLNKG